MTKKRNPDIAEISKNRNWQVERTGLKSENIEPLLQEHHTVKQDRDK